MYYGICTCAPSRAGQGSGNYRGLTFDIPASMFDVTRSYV